MKKRKIGIVLMAAVMMLGIPATAYADDTVHTVNASVTKNLELADGITVPDTTIIFFAEKLPHR